MTAVLLLPVWVYAQSDKYGLGATAGSSGLDKTSSNDLPELLGTIIGSGLGILGIIFFIIMVYGGFKWMIARGNEEDSKKAIETIFGAIIGTVIVLSSYAVTSFVFQGVKDGSNSERLYEQGVCLCTLPGNETPVCSDMYSFEVADCKDKCGDKVDKVEIIEDTLCTEKCTNIPYWTKDGDMCLFP